MARLVATALWGNLADLSLSAGHLARVRARARVGVRARARVRARPLFLSLPDLSPLGRRRARLARRRVGGRLHRGTLPDV